VSKSSSGFSYPLLVSVSVFLCSCFASLSLSSLSLFTLSMAVTTIKYLFSNYCHILILPKLCKVPFPKHSTHYLPNTYIYIYICSYDEHMCLQKCTVEGFVVTFQLLFVCVFCNKGTLVFAV